MRFFQEDINWSTPQHLVVDVLETRNTEINLNFCVVNKISCCQKNKLFTQPGSCPVKSVSFKVGVLVSLGILAPRGARLALL